MTSKSAINLKIAALKRYLVILKKLQATSVKEMTQDEIIRGAVERYLYLACQSAIDLAEQILALKKLSVPVSAAVSRIFSASASSHEAEDSRSSSSIARKLL